MRSLQGIVAASLLASAILAGPNPGISVARADNNSEPPRQEAPNQEQVKQPAKQQQTDEDEFLYELRTPQAVRTYEAKTERCEGPVLVAKDRLRFAVLRTLPERDPDPATCPTCPKQPKQQLLKFQSIIDESEDQVETLYNTMPSQARYKDKPPSPNGESRTARADRIKPIVQSAFITSQSNGQYFCLDKEIFDALSTEDSIVKAYRLGYTGAVYGLSLALPFKLRRATAGFNTELTEGIAIDGVLGVRWRISDTHDYHVDFPVVNAGLTTLEIEQGRAPSAMTGNKRILGLTASAGVVLELSNFQIELMAGVDRAPGDEGRGWVYNDKVWYSFGFGYAFLKNSTSSTSSTK
jgi:hypothetical protein